MSLCMKSYDVTIQMKATEQYFPVVLFIGPYIISFSFLSGVWCDHSNESFGVVYLLSSSTI